MCTELGCPQRGRNLTGAEALEWEKSIANICPDCGKPRPVGSWPICDDGSGKHGHLFGGGGNLISAIHPSERAAVYHNPRTGEVRYPARADQPIPEVYSNQGYVRKELDTAQAIKDFEKSTGRIHEATHYYKNSATAERDLAVEPEHKKDPEVTRRLVEALR